MKRSIVILGFGVLLLFVIATVVQGAKTRINRTEPKRTEQTSQKTSSVKPQTTSKAVEVTSTPSEAKTVSPALPEAAVSVPVRSPDREPVAESENYEISWQSVNAGGGTAASASYNCNATAGQASVGYAASENYAAGIGYWYGASGGGGGDCQCPYQADYDADGFLTALDLGNMIDVLFAGKPDIQDPMCPTTREDFDNDNFPTALDLGMLIDHLFAGAPGPCDPCNPIQSICSQ